VTGKFNAEKPTQQIEEIMAKMAARGIRSGLRKESASVMLLRSSRVRYGRSTWVGYFVCLCALLALAPQPIRAAGDESAQDKGEEWAEDGRNDLSLFLGVTDSDGDKGFSVGLDYERRFSRGFGIGGVIEYTGNDYRDGVVAASFNWHAWKELKLLAAPGMEIDRANDRGRFLLRIGAEYGFAIGKGFEIAPALNFDFTSDENSVVYGLSFARTF
jgi:hypothetical protein